MAGLLWSNVKICSLHSLHWIRSQDMKTACVCILVWLLCLHLFLGIDIWLFIMCKQINSIYALTISHFAFFYFVLFIYPGLTVPGGSWQGRWERDFYKSMSWQSEGEWFQTESMFRLDNRKKILYWRVVMYWNRLCGMPHSWKCPRQGWM